MKANTFRCWGASRCRWKSSRWRAASSRASWSNWGGEPRWRENVVTDNGNWILDVYHLEIAEPYKLEEAINNIPGVVTNGIFARQAADVVITAYQSGRIGTR